MNHQQRRCTSNDTFKCLRPFSLKHWSQLDRKVLLNGLLHKQSKSVRWLWPRGRQRAIDRELAKSLLPRSRKASIAREFSTHTAIFRPSFGSHARVLRSHAPDIGGHVRGLGHSCAFPSFVFLSNCLRIEMQQETKLVGAWHRTLSREFLVPRKNGRTLTLLGLEGPMTTWGEPMRFGTR